MRDLKGVAENNLKIFKFKDIPTNYETEHGPTRYSKQLEMSFWNVQKSIGLILNDFEHDNGTVISFKGGGVGLAPLRP